MGEWIGSLYVSDIALALICGVVSARITRDWFKAMGVRNG